MCNDEGNTLGVTPLYLNSLGTAGAGISLGAVGLETDPLGKATSFTLDPSGNLVQVTSPDGSNPAWIRNSSELVTAAINDLSQTTTMAYDSSGNLTSVTRPDNSTATYTYSSTYHEVTSVTDSLNHTTSYGYDSTGDLITITNPLNQVTTIAWSNGLEQSVTDPLGHTTSYV